MRTVNVLCVCGSGTATSAMLSAKIRDVLEEHGYDCDTDETNPPGATGFLVGINEDEFIEQLMDAVGALDLSE